MFLYNVVFVMPIAMLNVMIPSNILNSLGSTYRETNYSIIYRFHSLLYLPDICFRSSDSPNIKSMSISLKSSVASFVTISLYFGELDFSM
jgi:hypothetical protein